MTARRKRPDFSTRMRLRVVPFHGSTLRNRPIDASSDAMCSGAATAMPPSLRKRWCNARYVGRARTLSPTQLRPITTVSLAIHSYTFPRRRPRPLPAIVHPQPELRVRRDPIRDHVVDSLRQRHRFALRLGQLIDVHWFAKLEPMLGIVRYAKSEHNSRAATNRHFCWYRRR